MLLLLWTCLRILFKSLSSLLHLLFLWVLTIIAYLTQQFNFTKDFCGSIEVTFSLKLRKGLHIPVDTFNLPQLPCLFYDWLEHLVHFFSLRLGHTLCQTSIDIIFDNKGEFLNTFRCLTGTHRPFLTPFFHYLLKPIRFLDKWLIHVLEGINFKFSYRQFPTSLSFSVFHLLRPHF